MSEKWKPKVGKFYWELLFREYVDKEDDIYIKKVEWGDDLGPVFNIFRTKKEALSARQAILKVLGGGV